MQIYTRPINHITVSVNDIDTVVKWYTDVLGFGLISDGIMHIKRSNNPSSPIFRIYRDSLREVKLAYIATGNSVSFKVFQFIDPAFQPNAQSFKYNRAGFFHIYVTNSDPDALAETVVRRGSRRQGVTCKIAGGAATCVYVQDP